MSNRTLLAMRGAGRWHAHTMLFLTALALAVSGCTSTPSSRLAERTEQVRSIWILFYKGSFGAGTTGGQDGMQARFPVTFERNGTPVAGYRELPRALADTAALEKLWDQADAPRNGTSHILVMTAQRLKTSQGGAHTVEYEAVLWDTAARRLVWKGAPTLMANTGQPLRRAEGLAGDVLTALQSDGLITLPKSHAVGIDDLEISRPWGPTKDR